MTTDEPAEPTVTTFDFRHPSQLSRDYVRTLQIVQESFCRGIATQLSSALRTLTSVTGGNIEQKTFDEYARGLPNPGHLLILHTTPLLGVSLLDLGLPVSFAIVELQLGGRTPKTTPVRALTDIESAVMLHFINEAVVSELDLALAPLGNLSTKLVDTESNPQFAQVIAPTDMVVILEFDVVIDHLRHTASLCLPFTPLQPMLEEASGKRTIAGNPADMLVAKQRLARLLGDAVVQAQVRFKDVTMTPREILALRPGDVIPLTHGVDEPLNFTVEDRPVWKVGIGRHGRRVAVQLVEQSTPSLRQSGWRNDG